MEGEPEDRGLCQRGRGSRTLRLPPPPPHLVLFRFRTCSGKCLPFCSVLCMGWFSGWEVEMATAAALFWIVLHHCKGRVDEFATVSLHHSWLCASLCSCDLTTLSVVRACCPRVARPLLCTFWGKCPRLTCQATRLVSVVSSAWPSSTTRTWP